MKLDADGILEEALQVASPNCDERPAGESVSLVVIHGISLPPGKFGGDAILRLFTNTLDYAAHPDFRVLKGLRVSAHFLVRRTGRIVQFVPCRKRAWHAGESSYGDRTHCNDFSVGIELEGTDELPYEADQYAVLKDLLGAISSRYPIEDVVGHSDISPGRKTDPGPHFDWERLRSSPGCS